MRPNILAEDLTNLIAYHVVLGCIKDLSPPVKKQRLTACTGEKQ